MERGSKEPIQAISSRSTPLSARRGGWGEVSRSRVLNQPGRRSKGSIGSRVSSHARRRALRTSVTALDPAVRSTPSAAHRCGEPRCAPPPRASMIARCPSDSNALWPTVSRTPRSGSQRAHRDRTARGRLGRRRPQPGRPRRRDARRRLRLPGGVRPDARLHRVVRGGAAALVLGRGRAVHLPGALHRLLHPGRARLRAPPRGLARPGLRPGRPAGRVVGPPDAPRTRLRRRLRAPRRRAHRAPRTVSVARRRAGRDATR